MRHTNAYGDTHRCNKCGNPMYADEEFCRKCYPDGPRPGRD